MAQKLTIGELAKAAGVAVSTLLRGAPCGKVQERIEERPAKLAEHSSELRHVQRVLRASLATCRDHEASGHCRVVDDLTAGARPKHP